MTVRSDSRIDVDGIIPALAGMTVRSDNRIGVDGIIPAFAGMMKESVPAYAVRTGRTLARNRATRKHDGMRGVGSGTWAFSALLVAATFTLDPTLAIFLAGLAVVFHLARSLLALRPASRPGLGAGLRRLVVYGAVFALSSVVYVTNAGMVHDSVNGILAALDDHRAAYGRYPERLSDLVPAELPEVPSAAPLLIVDRWFRYRRSGQGFELSYDSGFLIERIYDSQTGRWSVRD